MVIRALEEHRLVLLTGEAGTGKTTLLREVVPWCAARGGAVFCSPTRSAADTLRSALELTPAPGSGLAEDCCGTIHSEFRIPHDAFNGPSGWSWSQFVVQSRTARLRKDAAWEAPRTVVIDEVSMVSAHLLLAVDLTLRRWHGKHEERFGGATVLLVGDFLQLQPPSGCSVLESDLLRDFWTVLLTQQRRLVAADADAAALLELQRAVRLGPSLATTSRAAAALRDSRLCPCASPHHAGGEGEGKGEGGGGGGACRADRDSGGVRLFGKNTLVDAENAKHAPANQATGVCFAPRVELRVDADAPLCQAAESGADTTTEQLLDDTVGSVRQQRFWRGQRVIFTSNTNVQNGAQRIRVSNGTTGVVSGARYTAKGGVQGVAVDVVLDLDGTSVVVTQTEAVRRVCPALHAHGPQCYRRVVHVPLTSAWAVTHHRAQGVTVPPGTVVYANFSAEEAAKSRETERFQPGGFVCGGLYVALTRVRSPQSICLCGAGWHFVPAAYSARPASSAVRWWLALTRAAQASSEHSVGSAVLVAPIPQQALLPAASPPRSALVPRDTDAFARAVARFCDPTYAAPPIERVPEPPLLDADAEALRKRPRDAWAVALRVVAELMPHMGWHGAQPA